MHQTPRGTQRISTEAPNATTSLNQALLYAADVALQHTSMHRNETDAVSSHFGWVDRPNRPTSENGVDSSTDMGQSREMKSASLTKPVVVGVACAWLVLATVGLHRRGWMKWTTMSTERFPDNVLCGRIGLFYPTFGTCEVPSDVAYGLVLTTATLLAFALVRVVNRQRRRAHRPDR